MNDTIPITLRCWTCGCSKVVNAQRPQFAVDLLGLACDAKWVGAVDFDHSRTLIFCSDPCMVRARKKNGAFMLRPPKKENGK